jgi:predicted Zn finger-like uncharacterized protein
MKFQCDRCKTRYSIADEKVRGKVLKIRCKNCTAVVTVKDEGQPAVSDALPSSSALEGAFQRAMSQIAPEASSTDGDPTRIGAMPSFESAASGADDGDEWYVSLDGNQEGPFRVEEARRRVARRKAGEELYGWREGFDDWLLVDKIPEIMPPPPAEPAPRARRLSVPPIPADAGLMRGGAAAVASPLPKSASGPVAKAPEAPPLAREVRPIAELAASNAALGAEATSQTAGTGPGANKDGEASADNLDFEIGEASRVVRMPALPPPGGLAERRPLGVRAGLPGVAARNGSGQPGVVATPAARAASAGDALAAAGLKPVPLPPKRSRAALYLAAGGGLVAASILVVSLIVLFRRESGDEGSGGGGATNKFESDFYDPSGLGGSRGPMVVTKSDGSGGRGGEARTRTYGPRLAPVPQVQPGPAKPPEVPGAALPPIRPATIGPTVREGDEKFNKADSFSGEEAPEEIEPLKPDDVRAAYRSNQAGMKWCYEHALKNDPEMKVSRIDVTIKIDAAGVVSSVSVPNPHTYLGGCLRDRIRNWRFRKSTEGLEIEFPLIFSQRG